MSDIDGFGPEDAIQGIDVSRETLERLLVVVSELNDWRSRINLIGPQEMAHIWRRHVYDSLQLLPHISLDKRLIDLGSGAGFPGLILASCMVETEGRVVLVESVGKKCAFLREAADKAGLPVTVRNERVEALKGVEADYVTARAFAPLPKLLNYAAPWLENGAVGVFPKGRRWQEELTEAADCWTFAHEVIPSQSGDGVILIIREVSRGAQ
ncbi:MAG: 16S rRNA (guanine(527)-N(7))-methyltransferase RsmG [Pseudomonadota bacterium]